MKSEKQDPLMRGQYFSGHGALMDIQASPEELLSRLPEPFFPGREHWKSCYAFAWYTAARNVLSPAEGSGFVSSFIDAAFDDHIFLPDTAIISMFGDLGRPYLPGIEALDNFYVKQLPDGEIPREMLRDTGADFSYWVNQDHLPLHSYFHAVYGKRPLYDAPPPQREEMYFPDLGRETEDAPYYTLDNLHHPLAAWAEWLSYQQRGDILRLDAVFGALYQQYQSFRKYLRHENGLYVTDWSSMVNSPRNRHLGCGVDISCEMAMFALHLRRIFDALVHAGLRKPQALFRAGLESEYRETADAINALLWNEETGFYHDLQPDGQRAPQKTVAAFWALAAEIAPDDRANRLIAHLCDPSTFFRANRPPSLSADDPEYDPQGGYWQGAVWPHMQAMVLYGLECRKEYALAREIALQALTMVAETYAETGTIFENYPPEHNGKSNVSRPDFVGMSGIVPIRFLLRHALGFMPNAPENALVWRLNRDMLDENGCGCRRLRFGDVVTDIHAWLDENGNPQWQAKTNKPYILRFLYEGQDAQKHIIR